MADEIVRPDYDFPHLILPGEPRTDPFRPRGGGRRRTIPSIRNRQAHARRLTERMESAIRSSARERGPWIEELRARGVILTVEGWPEGLELAIESLELRRSGIYLLSVQPSIDEHPSPEIATIYVPDDKVHVLFGRFERFATQETKTGTPRHRALVATIASIRRATLEQLWTDYRQFPADDEAVWWEVWLRRTGDEREILREVAQRSAWDIAARTVEFPTRTVAAVHADTESMSHALSSSLPIAEVRFASLIQSPVELAPDTQREWVENLAARVSPAPLRAPVVCLLDTGIYRHTVFAGSLEQTDVLHVVGPDGDDRHGHGTQMAGLALFGDLTDPLTSGRTVNLEHRLESVKILPDPGGRPNPRDTYGAITAAGVAAIEVTHPGRNRSMCIANSDPDFHSDGRPSLWSSTIDALCFGTDVVLADGGLELLSDPKPEAARLLVVAAGNVRPNYRLNHIDFCDISTVEDPAQAWNALTVGAFTELDAIPSHPDFLGYRPLAPNGELSPFSRTSLTFARAWPNKPDIVMEGGNLLV